MITTHNCAALAFTLAYGFCILYFGIGFFWINRKNKHVK